MGALDDSYDEWLASHHDGDRDFGDDPTDPAADQPLWPTEHDEASSAKRTRPARPIADIRLDLDGALAYQDRYRDRPATDPWVQLMRDDNEADIARLRTELTAAATGDSPPGRTPAGSAPVDDLGGTGRPTSGQAMPDDGNGPALPGQPAEIPAPKWEPPQWPRSTARQNGPDIGL